MATAGQFLPNELSQRGLARTRQPRQPERKTLLLLLHTVFFPVTRVFTQEKSCGDSPDYPPNRRKSMNFFLP